MHRKLDLLMQVAGGDEFEFDSLASCSHLVLATSSCLGQPPHNLSGFAHQLLLAAETARRLPTLTLTLTLTLALTLTLTLALTLTLTLTLTFTLTTLTRTLTCAGWRLPTLTLTLTPSPHPHARARAHAHAHAHARVHQAPGCLSHLQHAVWGNGDERWYRAYMNVLTPSLTLRLTRTLPLIPTLTPALAYA